MLALTSLRPILALAASNVVSSSVKVASSSFFNELSFGSFLFVISHHFFRTRSS